MLQFSKSNGKKLLNFLLGQQKHTLDKQDSGYDERQTILLKPNTFGKRFVPSNMKSTPVYFMQEKWSSNYACPYKNTNMNGPKLKWIKNKDKKIFYWILYEFDTCFCMIYVFILLNHTVGQHKSLSLYQTVKFSRTWSNWSTILVLPLNQIRIVDFSPGTGRSTNSRFQLTQSFIFFRKRK